MQKSLAYLSRFVKCSSLILSVLGYRWIRPLIEKNGQFVTETKKNSQLQLPTMNRTLTPMMIRMIMTTTIYWDNTELLRFIEIITANITDRITKLPLVICLLLINLLTQTRAEKYSWAPDNNRTRDILICGETL